MFKGLESLAGSAVEDLSVIEADVDLEAANETIQEALTDLLDIEQEFGVLNQMTDGINDLDALRATMESFGLQPGQVAFADYDKRLSTAIASFPAVEGMVQPWMPDSVENQAALEGVVDTIKNTITAWARRAMEVAMSGLTKIGGLAGGWMEKFKKVLSAAASKIFNGDNTAKDGTPSAGVLNKIMAAVRSVPSHLKSLWATKLPENEEEFKQLTHSGATEAATLEMASDGDGVFKMISESEGNAGKSLASLGYNESEAKGLLSWIKAFIGGNLGNFFKSLGGIIKTAFEGLMKRSGEAAVWARKWLSHALAKTWSMVRGVFVKGLSRIWSAATSLWKGGAAEDTKQLAGATA